MGDNEQTQNEKVCPFCGSRRLVKAGKQYDKHGEIQRYLCRGCGRMTTKPVMTTEVSA